MKIIIILVGICFGLLAGVFLLHFSRLQKYITIKKVSIGKYWVLFDFLCKFCLPIIFGIIFFIGPPFLFRLILMDQLITKIFGSIKQMGSLYFYSFVLTYFISMVVLIKSGKIQTKKTAPNKKKKKVDNKESAP